MAKRKPLEAQEAVEALVEAVADLAEVFEEPVEVEPLPEPNPADQFQTLPGLVNVGNKTLHDLDAGITYYRGTSHRNIYLTPSVEFWLETGALVRA